MRKYKLISVLAEETAKEVVRNEESLHIPQELRIRSGGTERHSASN